MTHRTDLSENVSRADAAETLGVSVRTVDRMIADGKLPIVKPSPGTIRIPVEAIQARLTPTTTPTPAAAETNEVAA